MPLPSLHRASGRAVRQDPHRARLLPLCRLSASRLTSTRSSSSARLPHRTTATHGRLVPGRDAAARLGRSAPHHARRGLCCCARLACPMLPTPSEFCHGLIRWEAGERDPHVGYKSFGFGGLLEWDDKNLAPNFTGGTRKVSFGGRFRVPCWRYCKD